MRHLYGVIFLLIFAVNIEKGYGKVSKTDEIVEKIFDTYPDFLKIGFQKIGVYISCSQKLDCAELKKNISVRFENTGIDADFDVSSPKEARLKGIPFFSRLNIKVEKNNLIIELFNTNLKYFFWETVLKQNFTSGKHYFFKYILSPDLRSFFKLPLPEIKPDNLKKKGIFPFQGKGESKIFHVAFCDLDGNGNDDLIFITRNSASVFSIDQDGKLYRLQKILFNSLVKRRTRLKEPVIKTVCYPKNKTIFVGHSDYKYLFFIKNGKPFPTKLSRFFPLKIEKSVIFLVRSEKRPWKLKKRLYMYNVNSFNSKGIINLTENFNDIKLVNNCMMILDTNSILKVFFKGKKQSLDFSQVGSAFTAYDLGGTGELFYVYSSAIYPEENRDVLMIRTSKKIFYESQSLPIISVAAGDLNGDGYKEVCVLNKNFQTNEVTINLYFYDYD